MSRLTFKQWLIHQVSFNPQSVYDNLDDREKYIDLFNLKPEDCVEKLYEHVDEYDVFWKYMNGNYRDYHRMLPAWNTLVTDTKVVYAGIKLGKRSYLENSYVRVIIGYDILNLGLDTPVYYHNNKVHKWGITIPGFIDSTNVYPFGNEFVLYLPNLDNKQTVTPAEIRANLTSPLKYNIVVCLV